jgi:hypothetical protein
MIKKFAFTPVVLLISGNMEKLPILNSRSLLLLKKDSPQKISTISKSVRLFPGWEKLEKGLTIFYKGAVKGHKGQ